MAIATHHPEKTKTEVVVVSEAHVTLDLTIEEAQMLREVMGNFTNESELPSGVYDALEPHTELRCSEHVTHRDGSAVKALYYS